MYKLGEKAYSIIFPSDGEMISKNCVVGSAVLSADNLLSLSIATILPPKTSMAGPRFNSSMISNAALSGCLANSLALYKIPSLIVQAVPVVQAVPAVDMDILVIQIIADNHD